MKDSEKKYDIGVVGYWWSTNYGSVATYYALFKEIEEAGLRPVFIDRPDSASGGEGLDVFSRKFMQKNAAVSESFSWDEMERYDSLCDSFVIGSDQVWTSTSLKIYKYFFFLDFVSDEKNKFAYASSFGETFQVGEEQTKKVSSCLKRFSNISVREFQAVDICRDQLGVEAEWVMDPVFLLNRQHWTDLGNQAKRKTADILGKDQKYLLAYILNPSDEKREIVHEVAKETGLPVICILDGRKGTFANNSKTFAMENTIEKATEEEWLWFFEHADYIVTDSQHGSAFSILMNKQFICCSNKKWGQARFVSLFGLLGLRERQQITLEDVKKTRLWEKPIDYAQVNSVLSARVKSSKEWLRQALFPKADRIKEETVAKVAQEKRCSGCGACAAVCPKGAIRMEQNKDGFFNPVVNANKCVLCGLCLKKCIHEHPVYQNAEKPVCYAMMAQDDIRRVSSSGGMFTVAAEYILQQGGYVCGAVFREDHSVEMIVTNQREDLERLRASKYIQADAGQVYAQIKALLLEGKTVLFTGTPCQVAALNAFLGKKYDNLYTIDVLCHGVPSHKSFQKYHRDVLGGKKISGLYFRAKKPWGWRTGMNAFFEDGTSYSELGGSDPYLSAFQKCISKNPGCNSCTSNHLPRQADLTMGDFWGIPQNDPEMHDKKGTSVVLVNSPAGERLFDLLKPSMKKWKKEPLAAAVSRNRVIQRPSKPHKNQNAFFAYLDRLDFRALVNGCMNNRLYDEQKRELLKTVREAELELYCLARTAAAKSRGRRIVTLQKSPVFERLLQQHFGKTVAFTVSLSAGEIDRKTVFPLEKLARQAAGCYLVSLNTPYTKALAEKLEKFGYSPEEDFLFRRHEPLVLKNHSLENGYYEDCYGNTIEGDTGSIGEIILRGCNNHLVLGEGVERPENLRFDLTSNATVRIGRQCSFAGTVTVEVRGLSGMSRLVLGDRCRLKESSFRFSNHSRTTTVLINEDCTFEEQTTFEAEAGKQIIIGRDCMLMHGVDLRTGEDCSVFDVNTGSSISAGEEKVPTAGQIVLGEHVFVGRNSCLLEGALIGSGSMVSASAVVKEVFANNCRVEGDPARVGRTDIAWSRERNSTDPASCGRPAYVARTAAAAAPISGRDVLVYTDNNPIGRQLIKALRELGNRVTVANRGLVMDELDADVSRLTVEMSKPESARKALEGKAFDVVFDLMGTCSNYVENLLSNVKCGRYVQLSTVQVYQKLSMELREEQFDPAAIPLVMCGRKDADYVEGKRQAEALVYQKYSGLPAVTVRVPYVMPTARLGVYAGSIQKGIPMAIKDPDRELAFVRDVEAGRFLCWIAAQDYCGPVNFASAGSVPVRGILDYFEQKAGRKSILSDDKSLPKEPFKKFNEDGYSMNLDRLTSLHYTPSVLKDWFWDELDRVWETTIK